MTRSALLLILFGTSCAAFGHEEHACVSELASETYRWVQSAEYDEDSHDNVKVVLTPHALLGEETERALLEVFYYAKRGDLGTVPVDAWKQVAQFGLHPNTPEIGEKAKMLLLNHNVRFILHYILRKTAYHNRLPLLDLIMAGRNGLEIAIERFDITKYNTLLTYAGWWIRVQINTLIANEAFIIKISPREYVGFVMWKKLKRRLKTQLNYSPSFEETYDFVVSVYREKLVKKLGREPTERELQKKLQNAVCFSKDRNATKVRINKLSTIIGSTRDLAVTEHLAPKTETQAYSNAEKEALRVTLDEQTCLTSAESAIIRLRYSLWDADQVYTLLRRRFRGKLTDSKEAEKLCRVFRGSIGRPHAHLRLDPKNISEVEDILSEAPDDYADYEVALIEIAVLLGVPREQAIERVEVRRKFGFRQVAILLGVSHQTPHNQHEKAFQKLKKTITEKRNDILHEEEGVQ